MATEQVTSLPYVGSAKQLADIHPFAPLTADEISASAQILKESWPEATDIHFNSITLLEPNKDVVTPYLAAERAGKKTVAIQRRSFVVYCIRNTVCYQPIHLITGWQKKSSKTEPFLFDCSQTF